MRRNSLGMKSSVSCLVLVGLFSARASGQTPAGVECETTPACAALFARAQQQSKQGQLADAEKSYKMAYEVSHDARLLFNIARVLDKQGFDAQAIAHYRQFIDAPLSNQEQKAKARTYLEQLEARQGPVIFVPTPLVEVEPSPAGYSPEDQSKKPVYKKGWFWGVMLGSVGAVGLGLGLGLGLGTRKPTIPGDTNLIEPTF